MNLAVLPLNADSQLLIIGSVGLGNDPSELTPSRGAQVLGPLEDSIGSVASNLLLGVTGNAIYGVLEALARSLRTGGSLPRADLLGYAEITTLVEQILRHQGYMDVEIEKVDISPEEGWNARVKASGRDFEIRGDMAGQVLCMTQIHDS